MDNESNVQTSQSGNDYTNYISHFNMNQSFEGTFNLLNEMTTEDVLRDVLGYKNDSNDYFNNTELTAVFTVPVQRRTHKKKRINKKWAKRYGYKLVEYSITGKMSDIVTNDNKCDFLLKNIHLKTTGVIYEN